MIPLSMLWYRDVVLYTLNMPWLVAYTGDLHAQYYFLKMPLTYPRLESSCTSSMNSMSDSVVLQTLYPKSEGRKSLVKIHSCRTYRCSSLSPHEYYYGIVNSH